MSKKKLLVVTPRFPYPLYGGDVLRIFHLCEAMQRKWDITLVTFGDRNDLKLSGKLPVDRVHIVRLSFLDRLFGMARAILRGEPLQVGYYDSRGMRRLVERESRQHQAVLIHLVRMAPYVEGFSGNKFIEITDHLPLTYQRSKDVPSLSLKSLIYRYERGALKSYQAKHLGRFDKGTLVSPLDLESLQEDVGNSIHLKAFSNGIELRNRPFTKRSGKSIGFIGNLRTLQNRDAVVFFIEHVLPKVVEKVPGVVFEVFGPVSESFKRQHATQHVVFHGEVEDLARSTRECGIGVCPVRIAAGVQNKVLEYAALGMACVSTTYGCEGLRFEPQVDLLVADDPEAFAATIERLASEPSYRDAMATSARSKVERYYSWESAFEGLDEFYC